MTPIILLALVLTAPSAQAEWYAAGDILHTRYSGPTVDGTWKQDRIPGGSNFDGTSTAWGAGIGYRFGDGPDLIRDNWSVELGYRDWGSQSAGGRWVSDDHYRATATHGYQWLGRHRVRPQAMSLVDALEGGYGRLSKGFPIGPLEPYVSVGWFGGVHTVSHQKSGRDVFTGVVSGPTVGGGVKWHVWHGVKARAGVDSQWTITESGNPISSHWLTVGGGLEVPLTGW